MGVFTPAVQVEMATVSQVYPCPDIHPAQCQRLRGSPAQGRGGGEDYRSAGLAGGGGGKRCPRRRGDRPPGGSGSEGGPQPGAGQPEGGPCSRWPRRAPNCMTPTELQAAKGTAVGGIHLPGRFRPGRSALPRVRRPGGRKSGAVGGRRGPECGRSELDYTLIRAPFDGVVLTKDADVGDIVTPIGAAADGQGGGSHHRGYVVVAGGGRRLRIEPGKGQGRRALRDSARCLSR